VGKKKLGGAPDLLSVIVFFPLSDFLHEIGRVEFSETHFRHHQCFPNQAAGIDLGFESS
jgi:hypothetical protein